MFGKQRRSELESIQRNAAGEYIYTGNWFHYRGARPRARALGVLWLCAGLGGLCALGAGLIPAPGMTGCWYVPLPYVACLVSALSALWSLGSLTVAGDPIREFVHETACRRLPRRFVLTAALAGLSLLGEGVYLLRHGAGERGLYAGIFLGLTALACALPVLGRMAWRGMRWEKGEGPAGT